MNESSSSAVCYSVLTKIAFLGQETKHPEGFMHKHPYFYGQKAVSRATKSLFLSIAGVNGNA